MINYFYTSLISIKELYFYFINRNNKIIITFCIPWGTTPFDFGFCFFNRVRDIAFCSYSSDIGYMGADLLWIWKSREELTETVPIRRSVWLMNGILYCHTCQYWADSDPHIFHDLSEKLYRELLEDIIEPIWALLKIIKTIWKIIVLSSI